MNRAALEHILRAAAALANEREFVVIGSQAVLAQFPEAPDALLASIEVDLYPRHAPGKSDVIDGAIGELSAFHQTFGYYAHGVDDTTATLPAGWAERLVPIQNENTAGAIGWCLEVHDLALSKLVAGRDKDLEFLRVLLREQLAQPCCASALMRCRCPRVNFRLCASGCVGLRWLCPDSPALARSSVPAPDGRLRIPEGRRPAVPSPCPAPR